MLAKDFFAGLIALAGARALLLSINAVDKKRNKENIKLYFILIS
jgi:hypothetical protein